MKKNGFSKGIGLSVMAAMLLGSSAYAAQIVGADVGGADPYAEWNPNTQFGFGGLNLENVTVNMITADGNAPIVGTFDPITGEYPVMALGDSYESSVFATGDNKSDPATRLGYVKQKIYPISEPTGIKIINNDGAVNNGKPENCIIASSYLGAEDKEVDPTTFYLDDAIPKPVLCSSYAGSSKRFQVVLEQNMMTEIDEDGYGKSIDLVFNIDDATALGDHRYQVFQKVSNFTDYRLDGFKIEVLNSAGVPQTADLNISLGFDEEREKVDGNLTGGDLWPSYELAFYPPGLWGDGEKKHLEKGWFDILPAGYEVSGHNTSMITSGTRLSGNYVELFGNWQPEKWTPLGMHEVISALEEPVLIAYWGTAPTETFNDAPDWHYGMDHNQTDGVDTNFTVPSADEIAKWVANPEKYVIDYIEDVPNVSMNYIVNVGEGIDSNFTIRITPKVSLDQSPPSYISKDDNITYINPPQLWVKPIVDAGPDKTVQVNNTVTITGTGSDSDGTIVSYEWKYGTTVVATTASFDYTPDTVGTRTLTLTVTDNNGLTATDSMTLIVSDPIDSSSDGGSCTFNPNSKGIDTTVLLMLAMGMLYPFRRRFIK